MMTSRERVQKAIHFQRPDRLPFTGSMAETDFLGDTVALFPDIGYTYWLGGGGVDEWGCHWEVDSDFSDMGQVKKAVLADLKDYPSVKVPNALDPARYRGWEAILDRAESEGKYVVLCNGSFLFERAHFLRGFENMLLDIVSEPEETQAFLRRLARYHLETARYIRNHFAGRIHGYRGTDDWGTQNAPIISPASFEAVFLPVYRDIFDAIHEAGMDVWIHSCGQVLPMIDRLAGVGLNVVNLMQPTIFPIPQLATLKGRVSFEVCADCQRSLPAGDRPAIKSEVRGLLAACCTEEGGLIESKLDRMFFEAMEISPETGAFCHAEYRRQDPFVKKD